MRVSSEVKVGLTIVLGLVLLAGMALALGRVDFSAREGYTLELLYNTVDGLREGAPVRYAGVNVGQVSYIRLEPGGVRVGIRIRREVNVPVDSRFVIATVGVLGDKHVEIHPGQSNIAIEPGVELRGIDPVMLDSILVEMDTTLRGLNQVVMGFASIADSDELQEGIVESTVLMRDTIGGLKSAVDQVNLMTLTLTEITGQIETFTEQLTRTQLDNIARNIEVFTAELAALELQESLEEFQTFTRELNAIPIQELSAEMSGLARSFNRLDFEGLEQDVRQFTGMMATLDLLPLLDEITEISRQVSRLELDKRGEELAAFTARLGDMPLDEFIDDISTITRAVRNVPVEEMSASVLRFTESLEALPLAAVGEDLEYITRELRSLGLEDMAGDVRAFTAELAGVDIDGLMDELTRDFRSFSQTLAGVDISEVFGELEALVAHMGRLAGTVTEEDLEIVLADIHNSTANVRLASEQLGEFMGTLSGDTSRLMNETERTLVQVQSSLAGVDGLIVELQSIVEDFADDGASVASLQTIIKNLETSTETIREVLETVQTELPLDAETFEDIRLTMDSIQKLNQDVQALKGVGEFMDITPRLALAYSPWGDSTGSFLTADARFEFQPQDSRSFYVVGLTEIGGLNQFQLQYGIDGTRFRQRYGIMDSRLGVGLDGKITDDWWVTGEVRFEDPVKLRFRTDYQWFPDWWVMAELDDLLMLDADDLQLRIGVERRF